MGSRGISCFGFLVLVFFLSESIAYAPEGMTMFFGTEECPESWTEYETAKGRLILSVITPSQGGVTVGSALNNAQEPLHFHEFTASVVLEEKEISADSCCDGQGACQGSYSVKNDTANASSGVPFSQLKLCTLNSTNDDIYVPFGTVAYFDPSIQQCPTNWTLFSESDGRFLVPGWEAKGTTTSDAPALAYGTEIQHTHNVSSSVSFSDVSYAGIAGCCNDDLGKSGSAPVTGSAAATSPDIPYIQMLTCISQEHTLVSTNLPTTANIFNTVGCPDGWEVNLNIAGRFLVALPPRGLAGASFGGDSMPARYTGPAGTHEHTFYGEFDTKDCEVGLISGCCADGYARNQEYSFDGLTGPADVNIPYVSIPFCSHK